MSARRPVLILLALAVSMNAAAPAHAWGRIGHRVAGRYAEARLSPKARAAVAALLEPGETLADASTWADEHRGELRRTASWHYVDVPLDEPRYDSKFSGEDPAKGCIVDKIREQLAVLKDASRPVEDRRFALRFVVHLVQDLHMPLHVGDNKDKGGNGTQVRWFDRGSNMHRVWDGGIIERDGGNEDGWLAEVEAEPAGEGDARGAVEDWATESLHAARAAYQLDGGRIESGAKLGADYYWANRPVVGRRLQLAGVRLHRLLEEALAADGAGEDH